MNEKKLYRDSNNKMLFGVGSGIGNYLGVDPNVVRLLFVATAMFGGLGAIVYIAAALILPEGY